ncbi:1-deoxy-D-xylulose-5-phosphate synthase [Nocardia asiatica]|uniref:1-deoxy-D-xylulose-5-phosphate synthase n=1 Tax=Nocardia asiatica TaxID=209252 RepID=UPI0002F655D3|nr:1-deoxy-D-xylulose-5-phosphate synthase [Nocardia asiatica]
MTPPHAAQATTPGVLASLSGPQDIALLDAAQLGALADKVRAHMIREVTATGGHLGASLGTVELTIALHRVFCSPDDPILFDTGHQAYTHKILTGRGGQFHTLRRRNGLSGYPSRAESVHDWIDHSHASVSLAWEHGIAATLDRSRDHRVVAVIGDGALTGGVAWEGLINLGYTDQPVVIVVNDNARSYDKTVSALATHLAQLRRGESHAGNLFTTLGFAYLGPVDGHDISATIEALQRAAAMGRPVVVHAVTEKGRGYPPAEADEDDRMHAVGAIDPATGRPLAPAQPTWTDVFGAELLSIADSRGDVHALTAAMRLPTGLGPMSRTHPDRVHDFGIAEQHVVAAAAAMASVGRHPVVAIYSTFLARAFDQVHLDVGMHQAPVTLVLDRAGITGPDGPSHHGLSDMALLSCVPGMQIAAPRDPARLRELLREAVEIPSPTAIRYPKAAVGENIPAVAQIDGIDILFRSAHLPLDVLIVSVGALADQCLRAAAILEAKGCGSTVIDAKWVWPLNPGLFTLIARHRITLSVEDGIVNGGIGGRLVQAVSERSPRAAAIRALGIPTEYVPHATRSQLLAHYGLTGEAIATDCVALLEALPDQSPAGSVPADTWSAP